MAVEKRLAYDAEFKLKAIDYAKKHGNRPAAREFSINECMVRRWRQQEDALHLTRKTKKSFRGRKARWPGLEDRLYHWISEQRAAGRSLSTVAIWIQAKAIANQLHIEEFKARVSWCFCFMKQRQLSIRTRTTVYQQLPADYKEKLTTFWSYCKSKISEKNILTTGNEKMSFTVVFGVSSDGQKLHPMVIFKRKTLPKDKFPNGIRVAVNAKGWMDEEVMQTWLTEVYGGTLDRFFNQLSVLLIFDSMHAHKTENMKEIVKKKNSELAVIPGGLTKELQPLDVGIICSFKAKVRLLWEKWMMEGEHSYTNTGRLRRASYATVCQWILDAWGEVTATTIIRGFAKVLCGCAAGHSCAAAWLAGLTPGAGRCWAHTGGGEALGSHGGTGVAELTRGAGDVELTWGAGRWARADERGEMRLGLELGCPPAWLSNHLKAMRIRWECSQNDHTIAYVFFGL
uniref:HTH CENPB-type domain-containing protein n=1 Tax=Catharus ustulatus TaxID=91951 RepID=A0A8C3U480_CATUS